MAIALSTDPLDDAADRGVRWVDRLAAVVGVVCAVGLIVFALTRLF
jgi:cell division protein FtsX